MFSLCLLFPLCASLGFPLHRLHPGWGHPHHHPHLLKVHTSLKAQFQVLSSMNPSLNLHHVVNAASLKSHMPFLWTEEFYLSFSPS